MFNVRVCGIAASAAFVISLLMGVIARSSFPAFIVRPIIFAAVFFVLSALINIVISHFLPDLLDGSARGSSSQTEKFSMPGEHISFTEDDIPEPEVMSGTVPVLSAAVADDADGSLGDIAFIDKGPSEDEPSSSGLRMTDTRSGGDNSGAFSPMSLETMTFKTKESGTAVSEPKGVRTGGLDQKAGDNYNSGGGLEDFTAGFGAFSEGGASSGSADILPDLDGMAKAFSSGGASSTVADSRADYSGGGAEEGAGYETYSDSLVKKSRNKGQELEWDFNPKDMAMGIRTKINKEG